MKMKFSSYFNLNKTLQKLILYDYFILLLESITVAKFEFKHTDFKM